LPAAALERYRSETQSLASFSFRRNHLTGLRRATLYDYRAFLKNDIAVSLGDLPLWSAKP
jgi:hypothetical protein